MLIVDGKEVRSPDVVHRNCLMSTHSPSGPFVGRGTDPTIEGPAVLDGRRSAVDDGEVVEFIAA